MSEIPKIVAKIVQIHDIREFDPGLTPERIEAELKGFWFQLTEEAYEFYQHCDGLESEGFYILSLSAATDTYLMWCEDWGCESNFLPVAATDDRYYAIQVDEEKYADSLIYGVFYDTHPRNAQVEYQSMQEMLVCFFSIDM